MRLVSLLYHFVRKVVNMAWFNSRRYPVLEWIWHRLSPILRWITSVFRPIVGHFSAAIRWRKNHGRGQNEPEKREEENYSSEDEVSRSAGPTEAEERDALPALESNDGLGDRKGQVEPRKEEEEGVDGFNEYRVEHTDELYCGYDSTWETEGNQDRTFRNTARRSAASRSNYKFSRFENASRDMQEYRHDYPSQIRQRHWMRPVVSVDKPNLSFYIGGMPSVPDGVYIHEFHNDWFGDYYRLEDVHTYIQWLFPLQEYGVNYEATPLTKEEIKAFRASKIAKDNLLKSYKLMLDFYGIQLDDEKTGEVSKAPNWSDRFYNLNTHTHNNLRITRILKCLGTLGYADYQAPLVRFFLQETLVWGELPNVKDSVLNYFVFAVLDKKQRRKLLNFAYLNYDRPEEFVWCPKKIQTIWRSKMMV